MKMKKGYCVIAALVLFAIASTGICISLMPDQVPMHYNAAGEVDRMGSKYENLIFPGAIVMAGVPLVFAGRKKDLKRSEEIVLLSTGISVLAALDILSVILMYKALTYKPGEILDLNVLKIVMVFLGVLLVLLGNIMPKVRRNSIIGLRTSWSMYNDSVWQKSQRFSGIASAIYGLLILVCALFLTGVAAAAALTVLVIIWLASCITASWKYYKDELAD